MFAGLHQDARAAWARAGLLFEVQIDLLAQCDLDCEHCYLDDKARPTRPTAFWRDVLDQLADLQCLVVTFSGGELFLRKDVLELVAHARARGLFVHLKTHGGRLGPAEARRLAELGVTSVSVSLYSHRHAVHDAITRRPGSHARTLAALRALRAEGVHVIASCSVMQRNRDDVAALTAWCEALGVPVRVDGTVRVANSGDGFPRALALDVDGQAAVFATGARGEPEVACAPGTAAADWAERKVCSAGHLSLYLDPEGRVMPCVTWPQPLGDLSAGDRLADLWRDAPALRAIRAARNRDLPTCARCAHREACDYCPGQAYLERGRPEEPARAICEATWARARAAARARGAPEPPPPPPLAGPRFRILSAGEALAAGAEAGPRP